MTDNTTPRKAANLSAVGSSGVVHYGGVIYHDDQDRAWKGTQRDKTIVAMTNDPQLGSTIYAIEMILRRVNWYVESADDSNAEAEFYKEFYQQALDDMDGMWPGDTLSDIITYLAWGYAVLEVTHKQRIGPWEVDPAKRSRYTDGLIGWRCWDLRPQTTREGWEFKDGEVVGFIQRQQTGPNITIPLDKCIHVRYQSGSGSPEGRTPFRHAYDAWYYKRNIQRIEGIGIERDLAGLPVMEIPSRDIEDNTATYTAAQTIVTGIRNDAMAGVVIASDTDENGKPLQKLSLLSSGGARQFDTDAIIRRYSNDVVNSFLAAVLRSGQDGIGTQALSTTMSDLFVQSLGAHLDIIQTAINEQAVMQLAKINGFNLDLIPTVRHGDIESADIARVGAYLAQLSQAGLLVDSPALRSFVHELAELPVPDEEQLQERMDAEAAAKEQARIDQQESIDALTSSRSTLAAVRQAQAEAAALAAKGGA